MRLKLDDNERGAFNYLIGGALVVLVLRSMAFLTDALGPALSPDERMLRAFQQGYPALRGELAVVGTSAGLSERVVLAVVLAVAVAFLIAFLFATVIRSNSRSARWIKVWTTRFSLLVVLCWSLWGAFFLPVKETRVIDGGLLITRRKAIVGDIPWPFSVHEHRWARPEVLRVEVVDHGPVKGCDGDIGLDLITAEGRERIAHVEGVCRDGQLDRLRAGSEAAALIDRELH
jgi:hypothetical protein